MRPYLNNVLRVFYKIGDFSFFSIRSFVYLFVPPFRFPLIIKSLYVFGIGSINIVALSSFAIGLIFTLQLTTELFRLNAPSMSGSIISQSISRELAPVFTSLMLIAKNGSAITAELGTMNITEQINALRTMSINPIHYLVTPRLIACMIMFPILTAFSNLVGMLGFVTVMFGLLDVERGFTIELILSRMTPASILTGITKSFFMGLSSCLVCSYFGMHSKKGSTGVGIATTRAVVISCVSVLVLDFLIGKILLDFGIK